jgi:hypothetical protein
MEHPNAATLSAGLDHVRASPADQGTVELVVRRPTVDAREVVAEAHLDPVDGLVGDSWRARGSSSTDDGSADPLRQITLMNARAAQLVAGTEERWPLAGDQLYVDLDLSVDNLPPGTRVALGSAVVEVTEPPHRGCDKFAARFGRDALRFVNSVEGRALNLRGINTRVVSAGVVRPGDPARKLGL